MPPRFLIGALSALALSCPAQAASEADRLAAELSRTVGAVGPGCVAGIFRDGQISRLAAAGVADIATGRRLDAETQFYAGSVSKTFTALAVAQLVAAGKIGLDDDIRRWLPELPAYERPVTVAMLLHHTSGVRDVLALLDMSGRTDVSAVSRAEALGMAFRQRRVDFTPGTRLAYSNGGYLLLSEIVARAAGQPFEAYVAEAILAPLGMRRSHMLSGSPKTGDNLAKGYVLTHGRLAKADGHPLFGGSGGLVTTLGDLARFDRDVDGERRVWTPRVEALMRAPGAYSDGTPVMGARSILEVQAAGLMAGPQWFNHFGSSRGFKAVYARLPARRVGLAMLCNRGDLDIEAAANRVLAALDGDLPQLPARDRTPPEPAGRYHADELATTYDLAAAPNGALDLTVIPDDGAPSTRHRLRRGPDGTYELDGGRLVPDANGQRLTLEQGLTAIVFLLETKPARR